MKFQEAFELLKAGKYVKRKGWENKYLCILPGVPHIGCVAFSAERTHISVFDSLIADFEADDFEEVIFVSK